MKKQHNCCCIHCEDHYSCLKNIPLFQNFDHDTIQNFAKHAQFRLFRKGNVLFHEGDMIDKLIIIHTGRIKICQYDMDGQECILNILHDGDTIYESIYLDYSYFPYSASCLSDVTTCEIERKEFIQLLAEYPEVAMTLIALLSKALHNANQKTILLSIRDPMTRLAGFLLDKDEHCVGPEISLRLDDIAASIGLRSETISRNLSKLEKEGFIKRIGNGKILVINRKKLESIYCENTR